MRRRMPKSQRSKKENRILRNANSALRAAIGGKRNTVPANIIKMLGMLGSDHAGERDSAACMLERYRKGTGRTRGELLGLADSVT